ncbi:MAG: DUF2157 domain-containing protein [bacterium]
MPRLTQKNLRNEVGRWVSCGIIHPAQGKEILKHYPAEGRNYWLLSLAIIGGILLLNGIILIIASNWQDIPSFIKIGGTLLLLASSFSLGVESQRLGRGRGWWETSYLLASVLPLLGLMLISQIFHVQGNPTNLFLIWTIAIAPLPWLTRSVSTFVIFLIAIMTTLGCLLADGLFGWVPEELVDLPEFFLSAYLIFGLVCAWASQSWIKLEEQTLRNVGEFWGFLTASFSIYILGFVVKETWFLIWALLFFWSLELIYRGYFRGRVHQVNLGFVLVGLSILSTSFRLLGTMFETGVMFIAAGALTLGCAIGLNHVRRRVIKKIK